MRNPFILLADHQDRCQEAWGNGFLWGAGLATLLYVTIAMTVWLL